VTALISKPGITNASVLSIPKAWDQTWFRSLVNAQLKGADVRNAIAGPGITITGTLASPFATISVGGTGATYPITLSPPGSTTALVINEAAGSASVQAIQVNGTINNTMVPLQATNSSAGTAAANQIQLIDNLGNKVIMGIAGSGNTSVQWTGGPTGEQAYVGNTGNISYTFGTNGTYRGQISGSGLWIIAAPSALGYALDITPFATGGHILGHGTLRPVVTLNSSGANFGMLQNDGANLWSLAFGATGTSLGTPVVQWGASTLGFFNTAPVARTAGFGTPVGGAVIASYNITDAGGANSNTNKCVAEILTILKGLGLIAA
jgi:hypothetical protein